MIETYDDRFEKHELLTTDEYEWTIGRPKDSAYWTRIIARPPFLILVGDIDTAVFQGHFSDSPVDLVKWAGTSSLGYIATKCTIGMGVQDVGVEDCYTAAEEDVKFYLKDNEDSEVWLEVQAMVKNCDSLYEIRQHIASEISDGWEIAGRFGMSVSTRVRIARAACRKLLELLDVDTKA